MLRVAFIILAVVVLYAGVFSIPNITMPRAMVGSVFESMTGKAFEDIRDSEHLKKLETGQRVMGVFGLIIAVAGAIVLYFGYRKACRWAWWAFLFAGIFAWLWGLVYQIWGLIFEGIIIAVKSSILLQSIAMLLLLVGLFVPFGLFFAKSAERRTDEE